MGRMAIPKMEVVRFKENDVIVASGYMTAHLSNLGDGTSRNAFLQFLDGEKVDYDYIGLKRVIKEGFQLSFNNGTETKSLSTLVDQDSSDDGSTDGSFNGTYKKDMNGNWLKQ